jgi:hypothetical protein
MQQTLTTNQIHESQCIGLIGEFCETILCLPLALNTWTWNVIEVHESVTSYRSLWVAKLIGEKGDPDGRNVLKGLADGIV